MYFPFPLSKSGTVSTKPTHCDDAPGGVWSLSAPPQLQGPESMPIPVPGEADPGRWPQPAPTSEAPRSGISDPVISPFSGAAVSHPWNVEGAAAAAVRAAAPRSWEWGTGSRIGEGAKGEGPGGTPRGLPWLHPGGEPGDSAGERSRERALHRELSRRAAPGPEARPPPAPPGPSVGPWGWARRLSVRPAWRGRTGGGPAVEGLRPLRAALGRRGGGGRLAKSCKTHPRNAPGGAGHCVDCSVRGAG